MDLAYINSSQGLSGHPSIIRENPVADAALCAAAAADNDIGCSFLLEGGATVNARDLSGRTPLILATLHSNERLCTHLMKNGARTDLEDIQGNSALSLSTNTRISLKLLLQDPQRKLSKCELEQVRTLFSPDTSSENQQIEICSNPGLTNAEIIQLLSEAIAKAPQRKLSGQETEPE